MTRLLDRKAWLALGGLLVVALLVRLPLLPLHANRSGGGTDSSEYKDWMRIIHEDGILNIFRSSTTDYIGYHWILWILTLIWSPIGDSYSDTAPGLHLLSKLPSLVFEALLVGAVYFVTRALVEEIGGERGVLPRAAPSVAALAMAAVIALHPASLYDAAAWGQIDALTAVAMLGSVVLVARKQPLWAGIVWGLGFVIKPQPIVVAPLLAVLAFDRGDWRSLLKLGGGVLAAGLAVTAPWVAHGDLRRILGIYKALAYEDLGRLSGNSWNFWWFIDVASDTRPDDRLISGLPLTYRQCGTALTDLAALLALVYAWSKPSVTRALVAGAYIVFAFWMVSTSSHDRYLYPLFALLLPVIAVERRWLWLYVPLSVTFTINIFLSAPPSEGWGESWLESPFSLGVAALNLVLFTAYTVVMVHGLLPLREWLPFSEQRAAAASARVARS